MRGCELILAGAGLHVMNVLMILGLGGSTCCVLRMSEALGGSICRVLRVSEALGGSFVRVLRVGEALGANGAKGPGVSAKERPSRAWGEGEGGAGIR